MIGALFSSNVGNEVKFKLQNANIIFDGNSLGAGQDTNGNAPVKQLADSLNTQGFGVTWDNISVGAQTTLDMIPDIATQLNDRYVEGVDNILIVWELRNDTRPPTGRNKELIVDNMRDYTNIVRSLSGEWKIVQLDVIVTWISSSTNDDYIAFDTFRQELNEEAFRRKKEIGDLFIKVSEIEGMSKLHDNTFEGYFYTVDRPIASDNGLFSDGTHQTQTGAQLIAQKIEKELLKRLIV